MINLGDSTELERYQHVCDAFKVYNIAARKTNYKRHVVFDNDDKTLSTVPDDPCEKREVYRLGKALLGFVNMDLTEYERERVETLSLIQDPETDYSEVGYLYENGISAGESFDLRFNQLVCIDRFIRRFQDASPYIAVFDTYYITLQGHEPVDVLNTDLNLLALQEELNHILGLCLNEQSEAPYATLSPTQRYALHTHTDERLPVFARNSKLYVRAENVPQKHIVNLKTTEQDIDRLQNAQGFDDIEDKPAVDDQLIARYKKTKIIMEEGYSVQTARDIALLELSYVIQNNLRVRCCARCNGWFMPCRKHDTKFCANVAKGQKYSCQKLAARKRFADKMREETAYNTYRAAYKVQNQRKNRGLITWEQYKEWQGNALRELERKRNRL